MGGPEVLRYEDAEVFGHIAAGRIRIGINQRYALQDAVQAHRDLESRKATGSSIFVV
ncbi:zinc-binding dehydrogenase [Cupriavidus basilensis]|uniref:zinc-binding dehydrogenase n=1 Tax=Cupriavidus basilensis TaxID=68895 RepID=UPI002351DB08|nr:zinc-binding dehydrogenase [Cupriavidus basilensis]